ncbi:MAG: RNA polymerase sigma factor region1.1 domain-containing protein, partial [Kiritimatiellae bacterium]|nr:RNA polymerase sigma factor region1.1 domain-containing protein [Kiritimatiellia bacterium]
MAGKESVHEVVGLDELVKRGKKNGVLTYQEIADVLQDIALSTEQIEDVYQRLQKQGIELVSASDS